jgi:hypothetical protein
MNAAEAAGLVARAAVEMTGALTKKSAGALRQQRYRERHKASQSVTQEPSENVTKRNESVTPLRTEEASQTVTERNENVTSDDGTLSKEEKKEDNRRKKRESAVEKRASQIPDGWRPDEKRWLDAVTRLGSGERAERELRKFINHAQANGRTAKNWNAAWANWIEKALEWTIGQGTSNHRTDPAAGRATAREAQQVAVMGGAALRYLQNGMSAGAERGVPGRSGPAEVVDLGKRAENAR